MGRPGAVAAREAGPVEGTARDADWGLAGLIERAMRRYAEHPLLISRERTTTYAEAWRAIELNVAQIKEVREVGCAAVLLPNSADYPLALLSIGAAGWTRTALNVVDATDSHLHKLNLTHADILITTPELLAGLGDAASLVAESKIARVLLVSLGTHGAFERLDVQPTDTPEGDWERDIAGVYQLGFTGGTTGRPKGVTLTHRSIRSLTTLMWSELKQPGPGDVFHALTPYSHASGAFVLPFALRGAALSGAPTADVAAFCEELDAGLLSDRRVTTFLVPTLLQRLADHIESRDSWQRDTSTWLDTVVYGAAPTPAPLAHRMEALVGPHLVQLYAQAEVPMVVATLQPSEHHLHGTKPGACVGRPAPLVDVWIRREDGSLADVGETGEICARGDHVMYGYWRNEEETRQKQLGRVVRTNDLGYFDEDGVLWVVGRNRDMIISGGFNVYPAQVENQLCAIPGVAEALVVGIPDPTWGELVVAAVVLAGESDDTNQVIAMIDAQARESLAAFERPKSWLLVDAIPVTTLGKPDRDALRQRILDGAHHDDH
jgi:fatty-acyl-CoA synthase